MTTPLSNQIKKRLKEKGMKLHALEKKAGLKLNSLRAIVAGVTKNPRIDIVEAVATALDCSIDELLGNQKDQEFSILFSNSEVYSLKKLSNQNTTILLEILDYVIKDNSIKLSKSNTDLCKCIEEIYMYSVKENNHIFSKEFAEKALSKIV